ncbi:hypothetical protein FOG51_02863 [Hanseniaspora uvarum]|uniref:Serine/threonine-protein kinase RIO2 n=1 Tax=Hanseniaspora uvarum TaxID=29833 RepID=A0A1E5RR31_HANUV|nr:hypothetical protein FOG48_02370 [Hanseniaspora uvarum]KAF0272162.1 hypothetical protein FOG51_02863 [Hanseniaspora uvarum]KAF0279057.1 hypothetical protein FOG50_00088 [Hanseniaspora uvarum]KKA01273.1 Serine/threonine-protein kinase HuRIO2 [Hanseniaspora uvarum DSM 2768]OEJ89330.1 Serine/threonine-protein kinase RIO2 [Hanseniaspora uvarum]
MKLETSHMRYLTAEDFNVLEGTERGSANHEIVPTPLIYKLSTMMKSQGGTNRTISDLAKLNLITKVRNAKYDGYKLTYKGMDYLALRTLLANDIIYSIGAIFGVGKESDIYKVSTITGETRVMKLHRLGRTSFQTVKNNRDYLKKNDLMGTNWMYLSKIAAGKEYEFLSILYENGFNVPQPFFVTRHALVMELIDGFPMKNLRRHNFKNRSLDKLYTDLMNFIVKLAKNGLIHCDYNEFNIMIKNNVDKDDIDELGFIVIDFPQAISIDHKDAEYYFKRDVDCIKRFFKKKLKYVPNRDESWLDESGFGEGYKYPYPIFHRDIKERVNDLDAQLNASGFNKKHPSEVNKEMEGYLINLRGEKAEIYTSDDEEDYSDSDYEQHTDDSEESSDYYSSDDGYESESDDENERIIEALSSGVEGLKMDKMGNYILE